MKPPQIRLLLAACANLLLSVHSDADIDKRNYVFVFELIQFNSTKEFVLVHKEIHKR